LAENMTTTPSANTLARDIAELIFEDPTSSFSAEWMAARMTANGIIRERVMTPDEQTEFDAHHDGARMVEYTPEFAATAVT
jgi:hypothetical protein